MLTQRPFIHLLLLGIFASPSAWATGATPIPIAEETAQCAEISHALIFEKEGETDSFIAGHTATVKTEFRITKINLLLLVSHRSQHDFQAPLDLSQRAANSRAAKQARTGNLMWYIKLLAFADWIYPDPQGFTPDRYELHLVGPEQCQDRTCCAYDVTPNSQARPDGPNPFFQGKIWVETADFTIIRFQGIYLPASQLKPALAIENYFPFDSYRTEVAPHLWLPSAILTHNDADHGDTSFPQFNAQTTFSNFKSH
jgi:hypothetical protein